MLSLDQDFGFVNIITDARFTIIEDLSPKYSLVNFTELANRTSCYLLSLQGARELIAMNTPISYGADELTGHAFKNSQSWGVTPSIAHLASFSSQIQHEDYPNQSFGIKIRMLFLRIQRFGKRAFYKLFRIGLPNCAFH